MISELTLTNFLAFRRVQLAMRPMTLLTGTNSGGKSSVLHALALLRQSCDMDGQGRGWILNGDLVELGTGRDVLHADHMEFGSQPFPALGIALSGEVGSHEWVAKYGAEDDFLEAVRGPQSIASYGLFRPGFQYLRADRISPAVTYPKSHEAVAVLRWLGARGENTANYLRVHGPEAAWCKPAEHQFAISNALTDQVNAWIAELSPGTGLTVEDVPGTDYVRLVFTRQGPDVRTPRQRSTNVGFGLTYALPIIVACLSARPGTLLLVENPEAHLHPAGQAMLGHLCAMAASSGAQVIVESHSDHFVNAIRLSVKRGNLDPQNVKFHFFSREQDSLQPSITSLAVSRDGSLPSWPPGFFDQWDRALDELLD